MLSYARNSFFGSSSDNEKLIKNSVNTLIWTNIVVMLGHVAVELRGTPKTEFIIFQFFEQHFTHMPNQPHLVCLIIEQLAYMIIAKDESKVMK